MEARGVASAVERAARRAPHLRLGDLIAGVSVALVLVPQSLAYAQLAGLPPYRGLYAAAVAPIAAAFFASSRYLQPGPTAVTSLLTFGALAPLAHVDSRRFVQLALLLAVLVGLVRILVGLLRAGVVAYLMSHSVLAGFVPAAAIVIVGSQLPIALGASTHGADSVRKVAGALAHPDRWHWHAIVLSLIVAAVLLVGRRLHPLFPSILVAIAIAIVYGALTGTSESTHGHGAGFPPFSLALPWGSSGSLLLPAAVIALVGFAEAGSIARTFAAQDRASWNPSREFVAQGASNVAAGAFGGMPVGASFSRSSLNRIAGAETQGSSVVAGLLVLALLPAVGFLSRLPQAALAAIVIVSVVPLARGRDLRALFRYSRIQFAAALATFAATIAFAPHVERGVLVGIGAALAIHLWKELDVDIRSWSEGDVVRLQPLGVLWFASAHRMDGELLRLLEEHPGARRVVVDMHGLGRTDITGALALRSLLLDAEAAGLDVAVEGVHPHSRPFVARVLGRWIVDGATAP
jgi:SulP family sulfate permease